MKHLISLKEQSKEDLFQILDLAQKLKAQQKEHKLTKILEDKTLIMFFQKTSTRTRLSFEAAMTQLGGHAIFLDARTSQFSMADFRDEIKAIMCFGDILMFRALKAADVEKAADFNAIPVIDACSEKYHPCQALGDILTMSESANGLENIRKVTWLGIENNVSNTLMLACAKLGINFCLASPSADPASVDEELNIMAEETGFISRTPDVGKAVQNADFVHTDTWLNMEFFENGKIKPEFEEIFSQRKKTFMPYQLNANLIDTYAPEAKIMHCMPCHTGHEISRDAIDHKNSLIFTQAENRLHIEKGILVWLLDQKVD